MKREQSNKLDFKGQNIFVGIDVHLKSWSVAVLSQHSVLKKFVQDPNVDSLYKFLTKNYPGADYYSVYEAGFSGFWLHEKFIASSIFPRILFAYFSCGSCCLFYGKLSIATVMATI